MCVCVSVWCVGAYVCVCVCVSVWCVGAYVCVYGLSMCVCVCVFGESIRVCVCVLSLFQVINYSLDLVTG